jgi:hypothetical protein
LQAALERERSSLPKDTRDAKSEIARLETMLDAERTSTGTLKQLLQQARADQARAETALEKEKAGSVELVRQLREAREVLSTAEKAADMILALKAELVKARDDAVKARIPPEKVAWRKLKKGMTEEEVRKLLGEPKNIRFEGMLSLYHWYYGPSGVGPSVDFRGQDKTVLIWSEPESR